MGKLRRAQTAEGWDEVADRYAELIDPDLASYSEAALELVPVGEGEHVLDVAAGAGSLSLAAAERGADVLAVDLSSRFVRILEERAQQAGFANVEARVGDGQDLELADETFDAAFSMFGLMLFPDHERGFAELHRVLRPGGRAAVSSWAHPSRVEFFTLFAEAVEQAVPDLSPPPPPFIELTDPANLREAMEQAGFEDVEVHELDHRTDSGGPRTAWRKVAEANPVLPGMVEELGEGAVERLRDDFHSVYEERYGEGPAQMESPAMIGVGTRP